MRVSVIVASILWSCLWTPLSLGADWSSITIGTEGAFPPWNATDSNGQPVGFEVDLARDLCRRMGVTCDFELQTWNGMIPALTTRRYDAIMAGMAMTEERERTIGFTSCYASEPAIFAVHSNSTLAAVSTATARIDLATLEPEEQAELHSLRKAFSGAVIGALIATPHADFVTRFFDDVADIQPV